MSPILKAKGGLLTAYVMRDAISCLDLRCRVCQHAALVWYRHRQCSTVMLLDLSDISLDSCWIQPAVLKDENYLSYICYTSMPETSVPDNTIIACLRWEQRRTGGGVFAHPCTTCSGGKWHWMGKWWSSAACSWRGFLLLIVRHKGMQR